MSDLISRQAAIEVAMEELESGTYFDIPSKIKGLPSEQPMQTNTHNALTALDCISRQAAIDAIYHHLPSVSRTRARTMLHEVPSAQPERKMGHWIEVDDHYNRISGRCSVCGWESHMYEDDVVGMDFCPNCGARLQEGEENG